ncbi:major facilitator superfamily domain-containing protein [Talaromyces proteolyticus]|uniref:Major facilitator superfamily domain-containing protein n=1 Tax=Talaromyces proteolyticus TaxID=1131652 RepID=A0AAD4KZI6_9EURO|nr:major facilitator superfamily domain-containing protein [Talaromyces proteolyticus]KAH8700976.1 major facilitator superfamily domain-containing protein [Talaromyces proteolyticus]
MMSKADDDSANHQSENLGNNKHEPQLSEPLSEKLQDSTAVGPDPNIFPDGGFQAWFCIVGGFCTIFASMGWVNCIGVFQDYYQAHQLSSYSPSTVAWIPAAQSFMLFFFGLVSGKMADSYGPRWPLLIGSFLHVFGLMMISLSKEYYQIFLAQCICSGIGTSFLFYPTVAAAGTWFKRHRALAFGIMVSGSSLGGVILPIMVQNLIPEVGFQWAMRITAFLLLGLLIVGNIAVKSRLPPVRKPFSVKEYFIPFFEIPFLLLAIGSLLIYFGAFLPFNFIIVQAKEAGMSTDLANYLIPIVNAASIFGRILPAHLGDICGVFNVCIVFTLFSGIISLAIWLPADNNGLLIAFAILYGFASGLTLAIIPALVASISDIQKLGIRVGTLYAFSSFGVLFGSPIAGAIVTSQNGGYSGLKIFCGITLIAGGLFVVLSRIVLVGPGLLAKK